ncbi:MAG: SpoIID/LytB domain-containing protein [Deltaproteobacteria bacterium]|nr:MAG: SpoIID/LytB domain-containing protein [Deltaproteobacteria bacterium]
MTTRRGFLAWIAGTVASARATAQATAPADPDGGVAPDLFSGAPAPDDPLEFLYSRRLAFDGGQPLITVRVAEGRREALLLPRGALQADARSASGAPQPAVSDGAEGRWSVRLVDARAGVGAAWVELEEIRYGDREGLARAREGWDSRGVKTRITTVGQVYGIAGHVVDTRKYAVLAEGDATEAGARAQAAELTAQFEGVRPQILREMASRPSGRIELLDPEGKVRAVGEGAIELRARGGITVPDVEFGMGYAFHGHEARTYPGPLYAAVDAAGTLALVAGVPMERLVKGVVPSEIFANAHAEALKAQAVTARGEVLAKIGARHLGDPYLLCAEQHCQVYRGSSAETAGTDRAVDDTRGEALFARVPARGVLGEKAKGRVSRLVDSVYSAVCGGFTENNDAVWGGPPDPSLRGRPDFDPRSAAMARFADGIGAALVSSFVHLAKVQSYCALSGLARPEKVRWKRTFTQAEVDDLCAPLEVGKVRSLAVEGRGISGRARALRVEGSAGVTRVVSELAIRKLFRNLNSGMFVIERPAGAFAFVGGGWGHGSGMCQLGAIGRAQRGWDYRRILGWYYSGARPERIY